MIGALSMGIYTYYSKAGQVCVGLYEETQDALSEIYIWKTKWDVTNIYVNPAYSDYDFLYAVDSPPFIHSIGVYFFYLSIWLGILIFTVILEVAYNVINKKCEKRK